MADRQTGMTSTREGRQMGLTRPSGLGSGPFRTLQRFADEMDRMFDDVGLGRRWTLPWREAADLWAPDVEVFQKNNELTIKADLPGLKRDEISVDLADDSVTIQGERKREHEEEREGF